MARSGSLAALEQRLAAQRREDDRLSRERRQREREQDKVRQQEHLEAWQREAEDKTAALQERMKALDEVLISVLPLQPLGFDHGRRGRQAVARPEDPDAQAVRRRRLRVGLIGRPGRGAETVQRPRMRGGQRRHGAEQGPGSLSVQVMPLAVARQRRRDSQAKVGVMDLALDRLERHIHVCNQPAHPHGQPGALDRQP